MASTKSPVAVYNVIHVYHVVICPVSRVQPAALSWKYLLHKLQKNLCPLLLLCVWFSSDSLLENVCGQCSHLTRTLYMYILHARSCPWAACRRRHIYTWDPRVRARDSPVTNHTREPCGWRHTDAWRYHCTAACVDLTLLSWRFSSHRSDTHQGLPCDTAYMYVSSDRKTVCGTREHLCVVVRSQNARSNLLQ